MVGTSAATSNANAVLASGQVANLHHGLLERLASRYREHTARAREEQLAGVTWTDEPWHRSSDQGSASRDLGSTLLRGARLT